MKARVGLEYTPLTGKNGIGLFLERRGYTTEDGIHTNLLQSFLLSCISEGTIPLYEDEKVKVFPVVLGKDAMQVKPGLLYDARQGKLLGRTINIDYKFGRDNSEPDA